MCVSCVLCCIATLLDGIGFMAIDRIWTPDCIYMLRKVMLKKKRNSPSISIHSFVSLLVCSFSDIHHSIPHGIFFCKCIHGIRLSSHFFPIRQKLRHYYVPFSFNLLIYASPVYMLCLFIQIKDLPIIIIGAFD